MTNENTGNWLLLRDDGVVLIPMKRDNLLASWGSKTHAENAAKMQGIKAVPIQAIPMIVLIKEGSPR